MYRVRVRGLGIAVGGPKLPCRKRALVTREYKSGRILYGNRAPLAGAGQMCTPSVPLRERERERDVTRGGTSKVETGD
jgi:hypothetical protein